MSIFVAAAPVRVRRFGLLAGLFACAATALVHPAAAGQVRKEKPPQSPPVEADTAKAVVSIEVPDGNAGDWLLDESSGRIFASVAALEKPGEAKAGAGRVVEFDPATGKVVREFTVGQKPRQLLIKGDRLVVGVEAGVSLYVINLTDNKVEGRVQLAGRGPYGMFCSRADNPWVYAIANTGSAWWDGEVFQVDVVQRKVRKQVKVQGWRQSHPIHVAMSPDGRYIVPDARGASSPSRADLIRVDERELTFTNVIGHHESFGHIVAAPNGRFWTLGGALYPLDLKAKIRDFAGATVAIHPTLDLVAGFGGHRHENDDKARTLSFETFSGPEPLGQVVLDLSAARPRDAGEGWQDDPTVQFDAKNHRAFVAAGSAAAVVDLKALNVKAEPLLLLTVPDVAEIGTGQTLRLPLTLSNDSLLRGTTFSVDGAPDGMRVDGRELVWAPGEGQVGRHRVVVEAKGPGGSTDAAPVDVDVTRPSVALGGPVVHLVADPAGERAAVIVAVPPTPAQLQRGGVNENTLGQDLVLVDVKAGKVLARRRFHEPLAAVATDGKAVYAAPAGVSRFYQLKPADLTDERRVFTDAPVTGMDVLPGGRLVVLSGGATRVLDGKGLGPPIVTPHDFDGGGGQPMRPSPLRAVSGGGVMLGALVLDATSGEPRMLAANPGLPQANPEAARLPQEGGAPMLWNRAVRGNQIVGLSNSLIAQINGEGATVLLPQAPVAVTALRKVEQQGQVAVETVQLEFRNLIDGTPRDPLVLLERPVPQGAQNQHRLPGGERPHLIARRGRLLVAVGDRLFTVAVPKDRLADLPEPLHFKAELTPIASPVKETLVLRPHASGGKGKITFELADDAEGLQIDAATGEVRVDTRAVWGAVRKRPAGQQQPGFGPGGTHAQRSPQAVYKQLLGAATADFPFALNVRVAATDEENQRAELSAFVILLAPAKEARAQLAQTRPTTMPADGAPDDLARGGAGGPTTRPSGPDVRALERKIDNLTNLVLELNRRVQELEEKDRQGPGE